MTAPRPSFGQRLAWRLEVIGYDLFIGVVRLMGVDLASAFGGWFFRKVGPLTRGHNVARRNLKLCFPDENEAWHARMLDAQWDSFGRGVAEFPQMDKLRPSTGRVEMVNGERLAQIAASGKPVVFVSGHLSNWEVMPAAIVDSGVVCEMTYRAANNPHIDRRWKESRARYGVQLFAPKGGDGSRELLAGMARGASVALMNDQKFNNGLAGVFFGHLVHTAPAPTRLALRFGTVLQPMSVQRLKGAHFRAVVHDPIEVPNTGDRTADIKAGVDAINAFMEARIRERPEEWFWVHRRFPNEVYAAMEEGA